MAQEKEVTNTIIVYTYRYIWKTKDDKMCVKYLTDVNEAHARFQQTLKDDTSVVSALREYINEINFAYLGYTEEVKKEVSANVVEENAQDS